MKLVHHSIDGYIVAIFEANTILVKPAKRFHVFVRDFGEEI